MAKLIGVRSKSSEGKSGGSHREGTDSEDIERNASRLALCNGAKQSKTGV